MSAPSPLIALVENDLPTNRAFARLLRAHGFRVEAFVLGSGLDIVAPGDLLTSDAVPVDLPALRSALDPAFGDATGAARAFRLGFAALMGGLREEHARVFLG